ETVLADPAGVLMRHHTTPTTLNLTIDLPTLLGLAENPAHLGGYGPLPAHVARDLAGDATWTRIITDPITTTPLDISTRSYRPTAAIRRHLNHINQTCTFPGCTVPAARCDADHLTPYPQGPTSLDNLHHLCRPHHLLKTHQPGWQVHRDPDTGAIAWTTPAGLPGVTYPSGYQHAHAPVGDGDKADDGDHGSSNEHADDSGRDDRYTCDPGPTLPTAASHAHVPSRPVGADIDPCPRDLTRANGARPEPSSPPEPERHAASWPPPPDAPPPF
ncbi:MAG: DUF222 domain-containing protein, partial [Actinomycetales bacterium]